MADLPSDFRAALLLRVNEGLSFREVAKVLEDDGRDGPVAGVQGPPEADEGAVPGTVAAGGDVRRSRSVSDGWRERVCAGGVR